MFGDIDLGGDPSWGYAGLLATGLFVYFTRHFAHQTVYQAYLSADHRRLGFQMHNLFGNPGRKIEVSVGNAKFLDAQMNKDKLFGKAQPGRAKNWLLNSSLLPLRVEGIKGNVLVDQQGMLQHDCKLLTLLSEPGKAQVDKKEIRDEWRKTFFRYMKHKKKLK